MCIIIDDIYQKRMFFFFYSTFCDFIFNFNLSQLIDKPNHTIGNILDLILTNTNHRIKNINSSPRNILNSDHYVIDFSLSHSVTPLSESSPYCVFDFLKPTTLAYAPS